MVTQVISIIMIQFFGITLLIDLYLKNYVKKFQYDTYNGDIIIL